MHAARGFWERLVGFFVEGKLVVVVLLGLLVGAGLYVAPFAWDLGGLPRDRVPVDAIPDIGENQQIVFTEWAGRSPQDVEDQITYPLTTALLGIPGVRSVRSFSMFGFSSVYVIFEDGVEFYWSRSRVLEKLTALPAGTLPPEVTPTLGPDATALGQVFWYTLQGRSRQGEVVGGFDLEELRSIQDWNVRYALQAVPGVSEVASVGGFVREYQVDVDPDAMAAHGVRLDEVAAAVRQSNLDVGARTIEINQVEYLVRGLGFVEGVEDLEQAVVAVREHVPIRVSDVARVTFGPAIRAGALDDGGAEAVGGVVVVRFGANPLEVIERVHDKIREIAPGLPRRVLDDGTTSQVTIVPFYDRTALIDETLGTLNDALVQQILITVIVILVMLRNLASSTIVSATLPLAVLGAFVAMKLAGVDANIMSLGGVAIAIGTMVDIGIVFIENIVGRLEAAPEGANRGAVVRSAAAEVAPAVLTAVATTVVSFLPIFALTEAEGRLFRPLAYTKTFAMIAAFLLAVLVVPSAAHLLFGRPTPRASGRDGLRGALRSLVRPAHLRDWTLVVAGLVLAIAFEAPIALLVVLVGALRLARPLLPVRLASAPGWIESLVAVLAVVVLLAAEWEPLGPEGGLVRNLPFVFGLVAVVLGGFSLFRLAYRPLLVLALEHKALTMVPPALLVLFGATAWLGFDRLFGWLPRGVAMSGPVVAVRHALPGLGSEFMPPFDEGSFLYMPTTMPHVSFGQALEMMQLMDAAIAAIPEVESAVGKLGRAESALDPAPVSMFETVVTLRAEYRVEQDGRRVRQWRDHIRTTEDLWAEIVEAARMPGLTSAPALQPISARIVMLQSGIRAPMGLRVRGPDLETIEQVGFRLEELLRRVPAVRPETVFADRIVGKPYVEIDIDREAIARHGLRIDDVQQVVQTALGGEVLTRSVEGRERYPIRVRYMREERDSVEAIGRVLVPVAGEEQHQIPLEQLASIRYVAGPQMIRSEDTFLTGYVLFDRQPGFAEVEAVEQARAAVDAAIERGDLELPAGVARPTFIGSFENQVRSAARLRILVPVALALIFLLLYLQFRSVLTALVIFTGVAIGVSGSFVLLWLYGQHWFLDFAVLGASMRELFQVGVVNLSVAVWVGIVALVGLSTDDGVLMSTYIRQRVEAGEPVSVEDVRQRVLEAGLRRIRPALMTTATTFIALMPVISSQGRGSDLMVPMALPLVGGIVAQQLSVFVVPVLYSLVLELRLRFPRD